MTEKDLLALVVDPADGIHDIWPDVVQVGNVAAIFTTFRMRSRMGKKTAARTAVERQKSLEKLMPFGTVIPALSGTVLRAEEIAGALQANLAALQNIASRLAGCVQYQLQVLHNPEATGKWMDVSPAQSDVALRKRLDQSADICLWPLCVESIHLPLLPGTAMNTVILVEDEGQDRLDAAVETIDAVWSEGLRIRLIGPSPAVSFASVGFKRHGPKDVAAAFSKLSVEPGASPAAIDAARRSALMASPEAATAVRAAAEIANLSAKIDASAVHRLVVWAEGQAATDHALARHLA